MTTSSRGVKSLVFLSVILTNEVDEKGVPVKRASWPKNHYLAAHSISKKLQEDQEFIVVDEETKKKIEAGEVKEVPLEGKEWVAFADLTDETRSRVITGRYTDKEISFTDKEKETIKHYWKELAEVQDQGIEAFEEMERLLA